MPRPSWGLSIAVSIGVVVPAVVAWAQAGDADAGGNWLWRSYRSGGWFMHPILACWLITTAVSLERFWSILRDRTDVERVVVGLHREIKSGGTSAGLEHARSCDGPLARVLTHALSRARGG